VYITFDLNCSQSQSSQAQLFSLGDHDDSPTGLGMTSGASHRGNVSKMDLSFTMGSVNSSKMFDETQSDLGLSKAIP